CRARRATLLRRGRPGSAAGARRAARAAARGARPALRPGDDLRADRRRARPPARHRPLAPPLRPAGTARKAPRSAIRPGPERYTPMSESEFARSLLRGEDPIGVPALTARVLRRDRRRIWFLGVL